MIPAIEIGNYIETVVKRWGLERLLITNGLKKAKKEKRDLSDF